MLLIVDTKTKKNPRIYSNSSHSHQTKLKMELRKNSIFLAKFWIFMIAFVSAVDELEIPPNSTSVKGLLFQFIFSLDWFQSETWDFFYWENLSLCPIILEPRFKRLLDIICMTCDSNPLILISSDSSIFHIIIDSNE